MACRDSRRLRRITKGLLISLGIIVRQLLLCCQHPFSLNQSQLGKCPSRKGAFVNLSKAGKNNFSFFPPFSKLVYRCTDRSKRISLSSFCWKNTLKRDKTPFSQRELILLLQRDIRGVDRHHAFGGEKQTVLWLVVACKRHSRRLPFVSLPC